MLKLLFLIVKHTLALLTRVLVIVLLVLNILFVVDVAKVMDDIDSKTTLIAVVVSQYYKLVLDKTDVPDFEDLVQANVLIVNRTKGSMGSGTTIKVDGKIYILSAGHLDDPTDMMYVKENGKYRPIILVRVNHTVDLALFEYTDEYDDIVFANIAIIEPKVGDRVWAVGNPAGLEDAITAGTLVRKSKSGFNYFIDNKIYYGSSGGGLFNYKGELIGVNVAVQGVNPVIIGKPGFNVGVTVDLLTVKLFVLGYITNELDEG
jgi:S1-C subfamily serine protease